MAILEKEVTVTLGARNYKYYEDLGYEIPRYVDSCKRLKMKRKSTILVKVKDLNDGSSAVVTKVCDECGKHVLNQRFTIVINQRKDGDGKDRCNDCGRKKAGKTQQNNVMYENSLEYWVKVNDKKYILEEYSSKNKKKPNEISYGSAEEYLWNCLKCKSEYEVSPHKRTSGGQGCPYCSGKKVNHTNCLWLTHPEVAELFLNKQRGFELTSGSSKSEDFKCTKCGNVEKKTVYNVVKQGFKCSKCADGISYPEKFMMNLLDQLNIEYKKQKVFKWSENVICENEELNGKKKYDLFLPKQNYVIEVHGSQHFEKTFETIGDAKTLEQEQANDKLKEKLVIENGVKYIAIDARRSNLQWIKQSVINSHLGILFDLSTIDWLKCHEFACNSLVKTACDYWNNGITDTKMISKLINCSRTITTGYLKQGVLLGWCQYDPKAAMIENGKNAHNNRRKKLLKTN